MRFGLAATAMLVCAMSAPAGAIRDVRVEPPDRDLAPNPVERRGFASRGRHMNARDLVVMRTKNARRKRRR